MERAEREVRQSTLHRVCRSLCVLSLIFLASRNKGFCGSDFLVVEKPEHLVLYNKYQQETTERERGVLVPFTPMRILNADDVLGDGFTRCMRVAVNDEVFYLRKDRDGNLAQSGDPGITKTFSGATALLDTIVVLTTLRISAINAPPRNLPTGERIVRVFRHKNSVYARTAYAPYVYGWIDVAGARENRDWRVVRDAVPVSTSIPPHIIRRISDRIAEVNRTLERLFDHFNTETGQQKPVPQWKVEPSDTSVACVLADAPTNGDFHQSTLYLVNDIENIVLGARLQVTHTPGRVDVRQR